MLKTAYFAYGVLSYVMFLVVYAWFGGFVTNLVPHSIDSTTTGSIQAALAVNLLLMVLFGVQHSVMARPGFKRWWTRFVPQPIERATYVFISNVLVILLMWLWIPIPARVWDVQTPILRWAMWILCAAGWLLVPAASLLINHFDLFGLRQVWLHLKGQVYTHLPFRTPMFYKLVRHPLYVGWLLAFWVTPTMSIGHLMFALVMTGYILTAIKFEERDLLAVHGEMYARYRRNVPMLIPAAKARKPAEFSGETTVSAVDLGV